MSLTTHTGTHVDAPAHFVAGGATVDALPLEILIGKARVVEIPARERVERGDLEALDLRDDLRVLLKTRMSGQLLKAGFQEDHVYLTGDAAPYLAQAGLKLVGFDYLSIDRFGAADFPAHHALLGAGVVIVEGLDLSGGRARGVRHDLPARCAWRGRRRAGPRRPAHARLSGAREAARR